MGTRGSLDFVIDGEDRCTYNHWDSYPEELGVNVLRYLRDEVTSLDDLREQVRKLRVVTDEDEPTREDIDHLTKIGSVELNVGNQSLDDWYCLLRNCQGDIGMILEAGIIIDGSSFPADSLFCEWCYAIDLDRNVFEVYKGFQTEPHDKGRFAKMKPETDYSGTQYYPVALVAEFPLDALPSDEEFIDKIVALVGDID
jgi:hypothetical protein